MVSLNDDPSYTALSYTWGPNIDLQIIRINDQDVGIRSNLEAALRHIQDDKHPVTLWVDAICINQNDEVGKSQQVQMMRKIFERALSVYAWLGPAENDNDAAMDLLNNTGLQAIEAGILNIRIDDLLYWPNIDKDGRLDASKPALNELPEKAGLEIFHPALKPFAEREYWTRLWIMQEFSVACDITLICGLKRLLICLLCYN